MKIIRIAKPKKIKSIGKNTGVGRITRASVKEHWRRIGRRYKRMLYLGVKQYTDPYYQGVAAQIAFFFILSIVPTLMLLTQILGFLGLSLDGVTDMINSNLDPDMVKFLKGILDLEPQATTNIILILMAVWAASRIQFSLLRVANYTYSGGVDRGNYWKDRLRSILTMMIIIIAIVVVVVVLVYGQLLLRLLTNSFGIILSGWGRVLWQVFRWPIAALFYLCVITFIYYVLPSRRLKIREVLPGSILSAIGIMIVTFIYANYTSHAVRNNILYGSMASIAVMMLFFYAISMVLVFGLLFNKAWADTRERSKTRTQTPTGS